MHGKKLQTDLSSGNVQQALSGVYYEGTISSREIALALGRTQKSILNKVDRLRRNGQFDAYKQMYDRG